MAGAILPFGAHSSDNSSKYLNSKGQLSKSVKEYTLAKNWIKSASTSKQQETTLLSNLNYYFEKNQNNMAACSKNNIFTNEMTHFEHMNHNNSGAHRSVYKCSTSLADCRKTVRMLLAIDYSCSILSYL